MDPHKLFDIEPEEIESPPVIRTKDELFVLELRLYVAPGLHRAVCAIEIKDVDSGAPVYWLLLPHAENDEDIRRLAARGTSEALRKLEDVLAPF